MKELEITIKIKVEEPEFDEKGLRTNMVLRPSIFMGEGKKGDEKVTLGRSWNETHMLIGFKDVDFTVSFMELADSILNKYLSETK